MKDDASDGQRGLKDEGSVPSLGKHQGWPTIARCRGGAHMPVTRASRA